MPQLRGAHLRMLLLPGGLMDGFEFGLAALCDGGLIAFGLWFDGQVLFLAAGTLVGLLGGYQLGKARSNVQAG